LNRGAASDLWQEQTFNTKSNLISLETSSLFLSFNQSLSVQYQQTGLDVGFEVCLNNSSSKRSKG